VGGGAEKGDGQSDGEGSEGGVGGDAGGTSSIAVQGRAIMSPGFHDMDSLFDWRELVFGWRELVMGNGKNWVFEGVWDGELKDRIPTNLLPGGGLLIRKT
jgi:hypothetical protein